MTNCEKCSGMIGLQEMQTKPVLEKGRKNKFRFWIGSWKIKEELAVTESGLELEGSSVALCAAALAFDSTA